MPLNLLALEPVLVDVLRAALPAHVKVGSGANVVGRTEVARLCPAVLVMPGESSAIDGADADPAASDAVTVEDQTWTVIVLVSFTRDRDGLDADFSEAGALMGQVYNALQGLQVETCRTLAYLGQQAPAATAGGVAEFAVDFAVVRAFGPDDN